MTASMQKIRRALEVFQFISDWQIYPENCTDEHAKQLDSDYKRIMNCYQSLKWHVGFGEAMNIAKAEYMFWLFNDGGTV